MAYPNRRLPSALCPDTPLCSTIWPSAWTAWWHKAGQGEWVRHSEPWQEAPPQTCPQAAVQDILTSPPALPPGSMRWTTRSSEPLWAICGNPRDRLFLHLYCSPDLSLVKRSKSVVLSKHSWLERAAEFSTSYHVPFFSFQTILFFTFESVQLWSGLYSSVENHSMSMLQKHIQERSVPVVSRSCHKDCCVATSKPLFCTLLSLVFIHCLDEKRRD